MEKYISYSYTAPSTGERVFKLLTCKDEKEYERVKSDINKYIEIIGDDLEIVEFVAVRSSTTVKYIG